MMTDERLAEIEARAEAAIPGPWTVRPGSNGYVHQIGIDAGGLRDPIGCAYGENAQGRENAEMMARAREDLPALCRALREERGWKAQWETANRVIAIRDAELREEREAHEATRALLREVGKTLEEEFAARKEAVRIVRALAEIPVRPGEVLKHEGLAVAVADLLYRFPEGGP